MRNNRIFQSLGIGAIVSMIRKTNDGHEGSTVTSAESASPVTPRESSDYSPDGDEVCDGEEVEDNVVEKNVKVSRKKKCGVKKTSKRQKSTETSTAMAPGRVFAVPPGGSKRMLELDEPAPTRVTRSKVASVTNNEEILLHKD